MSDDGDREQRWRFAFFVLGAFYLGLLAVDFLLNRVLSGFSQIGLVIFLAWLLAFVLSPLVDVASRRLHLRRGAAAAVVYAGALVVGGIAALLLTDGHGCAGRPARRHVSPDTRHHSTTLRGWQDAVSTRSVRTGPGPALRRRRTHREPGRGTSMISKAPGVTLAVVGALLLVIILSLDMAADADRIMAKFNRIIPTRYEDHMEISSARWGGRSAASCGPR